MQLVAPSVLISPPFASLSWARLGGVCLLAFVPALLILAFVAFGAWRGWFTVSELTMDLAASSQRPFYFGAVSGVGLKLWAGTAAVCGLASVVARRRGGRRLHGMFLGFGLLSLALMADDWLLLHELVMPLYFGVSEKVLLALYGAAAVALVGVYRRELIRYDWPLLVATFALFAASIVVDQISGNDTTSQLPMLAEDGAKLLGISAWFAFFFGAALRLIGDDDGGRNIVGERAG